MERAGIFYDRLERKKSESVGRIKKVKERRMGWDETNNKLESKKYVQLQSEDESSEMEEDQAEANTTTEQNDSPVPILQEHDLMQAATEVEPQDVPLPTEEEDEIL